MSGNGPRIQRRRFLRSAAATGITMAVSSSRLRGGGNKYRVGLIGCGWWGMNNLRYLMTTGKANVVALCDVDQKHLQDAGAEVGRMLGQSPKTFSDYRKMLELEKMDIALIATPDHWHALPAIAACEAGCDLYLEKPISHTLKEGRAMVNAARRYQRVVQVGTHRRSGAHYKSAIAFLKAGNVGEVGMVRAFVHYDIPGARVDDTAPPDGFDYDFWCGPAPMPPFNKMRYHGSWRHYADYGNGQLGDWGVHWFDLMRWAMNVNYPNAISSSGGIFVKHNSFDTPDTQVVTYEFDRFTAFWEHRTYDSDPFARSNVGLLFYGTKGVLHLGWLDGWTFYPHDKKQAVQHTDAVFASKDAENIKEHMANFLDCVQTRQLPVCDILEAHYSTALCLLGMISQKAGKKIVWNGEKEEIVGDLSANQLLRRAYRAPWKYPET